MAKTIGGQNQTANIGYDANGDTTGVTDPLAHKADYGYDSFGNLLTTDNPDSGQSQIGYGLAGMHILTQPEHRLWKIQRSVQLETRITVQINQNTQFSKSSAF